MNWDFDHPRLGAFYQVTITTPWVEATVVSDEIGQVPDAMSDGSARANSAICQWQDWANCAFGSPACLFVFPYTLPEHSPWA